MFVRTTSNMREWLSGGVSPCQGEGRGFESRLALLEKESLSKKAFFLHLQQVMIVPVFNICKNPTPGGLAGQSDECYDDEEKFLSNIGGCYYAYGRCFGYSGGSRSHICLLRGGGMMLSALLGPYAGFLIMIGVLLFQCLFFADGGLL